MQATALITRRTLDQLEEDIISLSSHINATEYEFLVLVREFDLRQGWKAYHFNNCAEWLNMKCGISPGTARKKILVANALFDLTATSLAFQKGDLSYSKARALTRRACPALSGITWSIGLMEVKRASITPYCFVQSIIGCFMRGDFELTWV